MELYQHQKEFLKDNPNKKLLAWETGVGKTLAACEWMKLRPYLPNAIVICPKNIKQKWINDLAEECVKADVYTKEEIKTKNVNLLNYNMMVLDEAHYFSSPLFDKGRSKLSEMIYNVVKKKPEINILLLTATPIRSTPWNIHTLACFVGVYWDVKKFRQEFFYFTDLFGIWHWEKKPDWRVRIRPYVQQIASIVAMSECKEIPPQTEEIVKIPWSKEQQSKFDLEPYGEPMQEWVARHRLENGIEKMKKLEEILDGYRKVIVVCHYRNQIDEYSKYFSKNRNVFVLHGGIKNQHEVIEKAKEADDAIFFLQAQMGAGFDASEFAVMVFASMSYRYIDKVQAVGRINRINNLHPNKYYYLLGGKCDLAVYDTICKGKDFDVHQHITNKNLW